MRHSNVTNSAVSRLAQAGAIAYIIWALLHFQASWAVYQVAESMQEGMARGRVLQDAWFLMCSSVAALAVAVSLNWKNDVRGWWINLAVISVVDLGFIFFVLIPGHIPLLHGLVGPLFWILGLILSSLALWRRSDLDDPALRGGRLA